MFGLCGVDEIVKRYGELDGELHMVKLRVDPSTSTTSLGLDLAGSSQLDTMSVFVAGIHPDSPAAHDARIRVGDQLLQVCIRRYLTCSNFVHFYPALPTLCHADMGYCHSCPCSVVYVSVENAYCTRGHNYTSAHT